MKNPKADLTAIMDLLAEWRQENGVGYVTMSISEDDRGLVYDCDDRGHSRYEVSKDYGKTETPAAGTAGESK